MDCLIAELKLGALGRYKKMRRGKCVVSVDMNLATSTVHVSER